MEDHEFKRKKQILDQEAVLFCIHGILRKKKIVILTLCSFSLSSLRVVNAEGLKM